MLQRGFSLIEVMVASALTAGIALLGVSISSKQTRQLSGIRTLGTRNNLVTELSHASKSYRALLASAKAKSALNTVGITDNDLIYNCVNPNQDPSVVCIPPPAGTHDFYLFAPGDTTLTADTAVGGPGNGVPYSLDGRRCPAGPGASTTCPILVRTFAKISCPKVGPCDRAQAISVLFQVKRADVNVAPITYAAPAMRTISSASSFAPGLDDGETINMSYAQNITGYKCPTNGDVLIGVRQNGIPICQAPLKNATNQKCSGNHAAVQLGPDGNLVCGGGPTGSGFVIAQKCPSQCDYVSGFKSDGGLICNSVKTLGWKCP